MPDKKPAPVDIVNEVVPVKVVETSEEKKPKRISDTVIIAAIAAIVTLGQAWLATRVEKVSNKVEQVEQKVDTVHQQVNSKMEKLLELSERVGKAEGKVEQDSLQKSDEK